jgi:hypothetical protein
MSAHLPLLSHEKPCQPRKMLAQGTTLRRPQVIISDTGSYRDMISGLLRLLGFDYRPHLADLPDTNCGASIPPPTTARSTPPPWARSTWPVSDRTGRRSCGTRVSQLLGYLDVRHT